MFLKRIWPKINKVTFFFLSFFLMILFLAMFSLIEIWQLLIVFVGLVILVIGLTEEKKKLKYERYTLARKIGVLIATPVAAIFTFLISTRIDLGYGLLGPVIAAGLIGLVGSFISHKLSNPIYCGAFVGMSSSALFAHFWFVGLAGFIAGLVFILSHEVYNQTGGTLGTIAFSAVNITKKIILGD